MPGAKVIPVDGGDKVVLIVGLSGTGKTTTTFTRQNDSLPVQDDIVALVAGGDAYATENGCFAKTFGLGPGLRADHLRRARPSQPAGWRTSPCRREGKVDFYDDSYTATAAARSAWRRSRTSTRANWARPTSC